MLFEHHIVARRNVTVCGTSAEYLCILKRPDYRWQIFSTTLETVAFTNQLQDHFETMIIPPRYFGRRVIGVYENLVLGTRENEMDNVDGSLVFTKVNSPTLRNWLKQNGWYNVEEFSAGLIEGIDWQRIHFR